MLVVGIGSAYEITTSGQTKSFRPAALARQAAERAAVRETAQAQVIAEFAGGAVVDEALVEIDPMGREVMDEEAVVALGNQALVGASH